MENEEQKPKYIKVLISLSESNRKYLKAYAGLKDISMKTLVNRIIEQYKTQNPLRDITG